MTTHTRDPELAVNERDPFEEAELKHGLSERSCRKILAEIELTQRLEKMNNKQLVESAIDEFCDFTSHPIVEVMMDRLSPGWADEPDPPKTKSEALEQAHSKHLEQNGHGY